MFWNFLGSLSHKYNTVTYDTLFILYALLCRSASISYAAYVHMICLPILVRILVHVQRCMTKALEGSKWQFLFPLKLKRGKHCAWEVTRSHRPSLQVLFLGYRCVWFWTNFFCGQEVMTANAGSLLILRETCATTKMRRIGPPDHTTQCSDVLDLVWCRVYIAKCPDSSRAPLAVNSLCFICLSVFFLAAAEKRMFLLIWLWFFLLCILLVVCQLYGLDAWNKHSIDWLIDWLIGNCRLTVGSWMHWSDPVSSGRC